MIKQKESQNKGIEIDLTGPQGNAYYLLGLASRWSKELQTNETHYVVIKAIIHTLCLLRIDDLFDFAEDMNIDIEWQLIVDEDDFMNPFNLSGNVRNIMIDKLEYVLSKKWKFSYDRNFIENTLDRLKNENPLGDVDLMKDKISKFIQHNEKKYNETLYKFEELWPELI